MHPAVSLTVIRNQQQTSSITVVRNTILPVLAATNFFNQCSQQHAYSISVRSNMLPSVTLQ
jgi:hypothetical protein